jgi:hypothetical protein
VPPTSLVVEKFRDFSLVDDVGATKHHLEELQGQYLNDSLKEILMTTASDVQGGKGAEALENIITKTSELKKNTAVIRDIDVTDIDSAVAYFENVQRQKDLGMLGIKTGLPGFAWGCWVLKLACQALTTTYHLELCQDSLAYSLPTQVLVSLGFRFTLRYKHGSRASLQW